MPKWETVAALHPSVMVPIAEHYMAEKEFDKAEHCLKTAISVSPDQGSFHALAYLYCLKGDTDKYVETLEEYLNYPDYGLGHGDFCKEIAYHYMAHRKFTKAKRYAHLAADTYAAWGLSCEAHCCEALRQWDEAEELHKACSLRYRASRQDWYLYCKRTGKGDLGASRG